MLAICLRLHIRQHLFANLCQSESACSQYKLPWEATCALALRSKVIDLWLTNCLELEKIQHGQQATTNFSSHKELAVVFSLVCRSHGAKLSVFV